MHRGSTTLEAALAMNGHSCLGFYQKALQYNFSEHSNRGMAPISHTATRQKYSTLQYHRHTNTMLTWERWKTAEFKNITTQCGPAHCSDQPRKKKNGLTIWANCLQMGNQTKTTPEFSVQEVLGH